MFNILYIIIYVIIWRNYWNNERKLSLELVYGSWGLWGLLISSLLLVRVRLSNQCRSTKSNLAFSVNIQNLSGWPGPKFSIWSPISQTSVENIGWKNCYVGKYEVPKLGLWTVLLFKNWNVNFPTSMSAS